MPDLDGFEVCRRLRADPATSRLPIIMLTAKGQVADKVAGFRAGADDYVVKPADPSELVARVAALLTRAGYERAHKSRVISFLGAKGGVGTTTAAVNVGVHMAKSGHRVALADLRGGYGTACLHLNLRPRISLGYLFQGREDCPRREIAGALSQHASGLQVLASPQRPEEYLEITPAIVSSVLDALESTFDFVLLDIPGGHALWQGEALGRSDFVVLVTEQEPTSLASAKVTLTRMKEYGVSPAILGGLIVHRARSAAEMSAMQISNSLEIGLLGVVPTAPEDCMAAARMGAPVILSRPEASVSLALGQVAERLTAEPVSLQRF